MKIRTARVEDESAISYLLEQLGYPDTNSFLKEKIVGMIKNPNTELIVYEEDRKVIAFMAIDFVVQLGLQGDFARISYFAVDSAYRSIGIGNQMEDLCVKFAKQRKCDRIEVHCHKLRKDAHRFYERQGYTESPKYFVKKMTKE